jgi:hypothetical protein
MRRTAVILTVCALAIGVVAAPSAGRDRPFNTSDLIAMKLLPAPQQSDVLPGLAGGQLSKKQIERFTCEGNEDGADPERGDAVDISCNTVEFGQDFAPDNEIAIVADPLDPDHLLAGSNDYFYRFNNATGARQALVPTGFFTSFDGGSTWVDGQIPFGSGNGSGDPAPAFNSRFPCPGTTDCSLALMAQLQNVGGQGGFWVAAGDVGVSRSIDGGLTWEKPVTVFKGQGAGIGPANNAVFWDKEYIAVDNFESSPYFGRIYVTATKFVNGLQGSYTESPIFLSYSDDGGASWSTPKEISGSHPSCTFQTTGPADECDEDQFSYPAVGPDGTVYVTFHNYQNGEEWEVPFDFDAQIMVVKSTDGGATFSDPLPAAQLEDGLSDMPFSVIFRQTIWGHQIRWNASGNIAVDPSDGDNITIVFADRGTANPNATDDPECFFALPGEAPDYDPCNAGPDSDTDVFVTTSDDGGVTWSGRTLLDGTPGHQWFPWGGYLSDGTFVAAWDEDVPPFTADGRADAFQHVVWDGTDRTVLGEPEQVDVSVTHWAGQYTTAWPAVCGPAGYEDPVGTAAEGKDCNVFHGDYTGLAVDTLDRIHVVWTGLNEEATSPQIDFYTGAPHDGFRQDAMYARIDP